MESPLGKVIDSYRITAALGKGGMGVVYKATDVTLDREVAVKMMDVQLARDESFLKRFQSEAKALAKLQNPNIVSVFALRETDFGLCIVMEYVEGGTLADRIKEGPLSPVTAIAIFKQLLTAFDHAHKAGIIHRDVKPSNIMLTSRDVVKVTDFGLAKIQQPSAITATMGTGGTLYYMSPEQIRGLARVDSRGDLYSIGMTLYETLAGRLPFTEDDADFSIRQAIVEGRIPPPDKLNPDIPRDIVKVVMKSIEKDPERRYQTAEEFRKALGAVRLPVVPDPDQAKRYEIPPVRRSNLWLVAASTILVAGYLLWSGTFKESGYINITTDPPGSTVFVNETQIGVSPIQNYAFVSGQVSIRVQRDGFAPIDSSIVLAGGETLTLTFTMKGVDKSMPSGGLFVSSSPPGDIFINEQAANTRTPAFIPLASGEHTIRVKLDGYEDFLSKATVADRETTMVSATLVETRLFGNLYVSSDPTGADIVLNGRQSGRKTAATINDLPAGSYTVKLSMRDFQDVVYTIEVARGETATVSGRMVPIPTGSFEISSVPPNAEVFLDNRPTDRKTPTRIDRVPLGNRTLSFRRSGFKDYDTTISVTAGQIVSIRAVLDSLKTLLRVRAKPFGSIYLDDILLKEDTPSPITISTAVGNRRLKAIHPKYGTWEKNVALRPDEQADILFDFDRICKIDISAVDETGQSLRGDIYVDGVFTEKYAPGRIEIRAGTRRIEVRRGGWVSIEAPRVITVESDQPLKFNLRKTQ